MAGRRGRMWLAAGALVALLPGCGTPNGQDPTQPAGPAGAEHGAVTSADPGAASSGEPGAVTVSDPDRPPAFRVKGAGDWLVVEPWSWCWGNSCADGMPPDPLPDLGTVDGPVAVELLPGSELWASWRAPGEPCGTSLELAPVVADGVVQVAPAGGAGTWQLDLFSRPPGGGDLVGSVQVTTDRDWPVPEPRLALESFFEDDGQIVQYGPIRVVASRLPGDAEAAGLAGTLEVVAADGTTSGVDLELRTPDGEGCAGVGEAVLVEVGRARGPSQYEVGSRFGPPPYALTVEVAYDGRQHRAEAVWPDDVDDESSMIPLQVDPPIQRAEPQDFTPTTPPVPVPTSAPESP